MLHRVQRSAIQTRTLARALHDATADSGTAWLEPSVIGKPLADLLQAAVRLLGEFLTGGGADPCSADFATPREAVHSRAQGESVTLTPDGWVRQAAILATIDRLAADLRDSTHSGEDDETPAFS